MQCTDARDIFVPTNLTMYPFHDFHKWATNYIKPKRSPSGRRRLVSLRFTIMTDIARAETCSGANGNISKEIYGHSDGSIPDD